MASGVNRVMIGAALGTGAALNIRTVGFRPRLVRVVNVASGGLCRAEWFEGMADASAVKTVNHDTTQTSVITSNGITPLSDGFTLGADTDLNVSGEQFHWEAHE